MNATDFQSVLSAVLKEPEQRFVLLLDALGGRDITLQRSSHHRHHGIRRSPSFQILNPSWRIWEIRPISMIG
jgi:hypothetical protein